MSSTATKPTFILISGGLNDSSPWNPLIAALTSHGYETVTVALPSIAPSEPLEDFRPDVEAIRNQVQATINEGKEVIIVMHSYSGSPGSEALKNQSKTERTSLGLHGGVIRLVYIMSFLIPEGASLVPKGTRDQMPAHIDYDEKTNLQTITAPNALQFFYHDVLPLSEAEHWAANTKSQTLTVYWSTTTYAAWKHIPTTFVICEEDRCVPMLYVDMMLESVKNSIPTGLDTIEKIKSGHFPFLSQVDGMVEILRRAAGEEKQ